MSIWEKLAGATAELLRAGSIGAGLGGVNGQAEKVQVAFTVGVIALGAKMAKADGVVTRDEVNALKEVFKIPAGEMKNVANIFNMAKQDVTGYQAYAEQLAAMLKGNRRLLEDVLEGLFHIAKADQVMHPREVEFLAEVAKRFGTRSPGSPPRRGFNLGRDIPLSSVGGLVVVNSHTIGGSPAQITASPSINARRRLRSALAPSERLRNALFCGGLLDPSL